MPVTTFVLLRHTACIAALVLAGCASAPVPPPTVPPPVSAAPLPAAPASPGSSSAWVWSARLDGAARSLRSSLAGSGIEVVQTTDQRLWVSLPGAEAFPLGRSALTRPAGGWLDQVAQALKGVPQAEVQIVGQPDARQAGGHALAVDRAASARDWMVMRGVPARRVAVSGQTAKNKADTGESRLDILIGERVKATPP
jgi:outer membrane protein OmpA-like peptidoglycan-associated protein